jgi:tripartite-type tricarboxylate transporter receptor subunit TctC
MDNIIGLVKSGKLRGLATATEQRLPALPDMPTFEEAGLSNFDPSGTIALFAPGGTPGEIVNRLNREIVRISTTPEMARVYQASALAIATTTPEGLAQQMRREYETWAPLVRKLGIKVE